MAGEVDPVSSSAAETSSASLPRFGSTRPRARYSAEYQIPRNSLALLMVAQVVVLLPLAAYVSAWVVGVALFCGFWRWQVYRGRWNYPPRLVKAALVVLCACGVALGSNSAFSVETASALCMAAFALKLIEMKAQRDAYLVIFLAFFLIAVAFLFDQSLALSAYALFAAVVVCSAMVAMHLRHNQVRPIASMKVALSLVGQALPLMIVVFLFFPRIAPLWSVPLPGGSQSGLSDRVTPGEIAKLSQSDEIAFRVSFDGDVPRSRELYFRGVVLSGYNEGTWQQLRSAPRLEVVNPAGLAAPLEYTVMLEPTQRNWLFALDLAEPFGGRLSTTHDFRLESADVVTSLFRYDVTSYLDAPLAVQLDPREQRRELSLPNNQEPRTRAFAERLWRQSGADVERYIQAVLTHIRSEPYHYTLQPPVTGSVNSVDRFWFDTRAGFCSHYAGAFVVLMRAVGVPARMVGGYQGGEINPVTGHLVVRSRDAHAWTEVHIAGEGWRRVDPTAAVAPSRIEEGLDAALSSEDRSARAGFAGSMLSGLPGLRQLSYWADSVQHRWNLWVVGYDGALQAKTLTRWIGELTPTRLGFALVIAVALALSGVAVAMFWRERKAPQAPGVRLLMGLERTASRFGMPRRADETPARYLARLADACGLSADERADLIERLNALLYDPSVSDPLRHATALRRDLGRLKVRLAFG